VSITCKKLGGIQELKPRRCKGDDTVLNNWTMMRDVAYVQTHRYLYFRQAPPPLAVRKETEILVVGPEDLLINIKYVLHKVNF
jgi:hypothetical protein